MDASRQEGRLHVDDGETVTNDTPPAEYKAYDFSLAVEISIHFIVDVV